MKIVKALWIISLFSSLLIAESIVIVTVDKNGKATIYKEKKIAKELKNPPKGKKAVILEKGKKAIWTDATEEELEILYDADIYEDKEKNLPEEKDKEIKYPDDWEPPKEIFDGIVFDEIEPTNGTWKSVFGSMSERGCSSMMKSMVQTFRPPTSTMKLNFSKPFNPNTDLMNRQYKWKKIKANKWKGTMYKSGAIPGGMSMDGKMILTVLSEKKMSISLEQVIILPKEIAQLTGSTTACTVVGTGHYIKIK